MEPLRGHRKRNKNLLTNLEFLMRTINYLGKTQNFLVHTRNIWCAQLRIASGIQNRQIGSRIGSFHVSENTKMQSHSLPSSIVPDRIAMLLLSREEYSSSLSGAALNWGYSVVTLSSHQSEREKATIMLLLLLASPPRPFMEGPF